MPQLQRMHGQVPAGHRDTHGTAHRRPPHRALLPAPHYKIGEKNHQLAQQITQDKKISKKLHIKFFARPQRGGLFYCHYVQDKKTGGIHMYKLISDGGCDFTAQEVEQHGVTIVPFYVSLQPGEFLKEGVDITKAEFFSRLKNDKSLFPKTAQPSPQDYVDAYTPLLQAGHDIISLTISSKLSGTYNSACLAAEMCMDEFPQRKIEVIDSQNVAVGQGLILKEMLRMQAAGYSMKKTAKLVQQVIASTRIYFSLDSLEYLRKGGRVGPTTALVGGILGLRPILHLIDGEVKQLDSVRGKDRVLKLIEEGLVAALADDIGDVQLAVGHILREEDAAAFKQSLESTLGTQFPGGVIEVGATIGTHAGPGAVAIAYCKKYEACAAAPATEEYEMKEAA
jgi:DegV family protein with EDD domain